MERFHSYLFLFFFMFGFQRRMEWLLESIYGKYLGCSHFIRTTRFECSRRRECFPPFLSLHTYIALQPNNEWSGSTLFYSLTKQKMERFRSARQTQNEIA
jgi:hypothetical protein